jgi:2-methylisocitrate lyase-like PEP mutase family enzyme
MNQVEKARRFAALHVKGSPLVLYNAWDAGSAKAVSDAGAEAIATSSWAVAAAHGYEDGEAIPVQMVEQIVARVVASIDLPVTVDFEGGYTEDDVILSANVSRLVDLGIVGINFEDRVVAGTGLYGVERQARRIATIRKMADERGIPLFINARTDLFLGQGNNHAAQLGAAQERAAAYAEAGASGFFIPGLGDGDLIGELCDACTLPVNVMVMTGVPSLDALAKLGVARVSFGPSPYIDTMNSLGASARNALAWRSRSDEPRGG